MKLHLLLEFIGMEILHDYFMRRCLDLAILGKGFTSPNPMVGAVLVYQHQIIGEGYHQQYGEGHAEVNCIQSVSKENQQLIPLSTLYVSLEPCSHHGKTPPCVDLILKYKIPHIVIACRDLSAKVNGKGIERLKSLNIHVTEGILEQEALSLNRRFFTFQLKSRPYIILKWAQSIDEFIASKLGKTKISGPYSDKLVHKWRSEEDAIWVGYNTVLIDNPILSSRHWIGKNPIRIVYDRHLDLTENLSIFQGPQKTIVFNNVLDADINNNAKVNIKDDKYINQILQYLHNKNIISVLVEGGAILHKTLLNLNLWDEIRIIQSDLYIYEGVKSADLPANITPVYSEKINHDTLLIFKNSNSI